MASSNHDRLSLRHKIGATVTPGDRLGLIATRHNTALVAGTGTYARQGHLYASHVGTLCAARSNDGGDAAPSTDNAEREKWIVSVRTERMSVNEIKWSPWSYATNRSTLYPQVGVLILGRITRVIRPSQAMVDIVAIVPDDSGSSSSSSAGPALLPLREPLVGVLRQGDLRPNAALEVRIEECVRPGDVVLARVLADGDRDFILTTEAAELGVVRAVCESSGRVLQAVSWKEMRCPATGAREGRKVAKPRRPR